MRQRHESRVWAAFAAVDTPRQALEPAIVEKTAYVIAELALHDAEKSLLKREGACVPGSAMKVYVCREMG